MPVEKKGFIGRKREGDVNNLEDGYKGKKVDSHNPQPELTCEYHAGNPGHGIETCYAFKKRLLELIKIGWVSFEDKPNINSNPLPKHASSSSGIGMIEVGNQCKVLKVSMEKMYYMLVRSGFLEANMEGHSEGGSYCEFHGRDGHYIEDCIEFCEKIAKMLKMGQLRIEPMENRGEVSMMEDQMEMTGVCRVQQTANGPPRLILVKPSYTKGNHNVMPYNYGYASNVQAPLPLFQTEISGLTRSGRCFTSEELRKAKGKEVVDLDQALEVNKPVTEEESNEFLKLIKHMGRIHATNYLYFTADELDTEGTGHNKPLYITVRCKDCLIGKVLIDNGSALNVLPKHMLEEMPIDESHIKPSTMMARAYDGSPRPIIGTLEVELYVGPQMFLAEETVSMIKNVAVPFIEANDCKDNNIHAFEIVNTDWVPENTVLRRPRISEAARMASLCFLNRGIPFQYNFIIRIPEGVNLARMKSAAQKFGLGYQPNQKDYQWAAGRRRARRMARIKGREPDEEKLEIPPLSVSFPKAAYIMQHDKEAESLDQELSSMSINTLGENKVEGDDMKTVARKGDEALPQLTVYTIEEVSAKTFVRKLVEQQEQTWKPAAEELETINVGNDQLKKELKIGTLVTSEQRTKMIALLQEYADVFAWSYEDMPGLDTNIVVHKIPLEEGCKPVKQKLRRAHPDVWIKVKVELEKQWDAGFLEVVRYPQWVSNIVVVPKKEGKIRVCVDFQNLNKVSPKDDFPLPHIDVLVDNAARSSIYSFMDGFSGYNQIKMAPEDKTKTTFVTPWGTFCYKVMPFGLKNAGATYQRAMVTLFHDMMHKEIEVYVDDMIAKSKRGEDHVEVLRKLFERLRKYELRLNPAKCSFGVKSGKLLGFVVSDRGIEVDPDKVKVIQAMSSPKTEKEVRGFLGRINYIARFIAQLTTTCEPIFRLLRKKNPGTWNEECEEAFNKIKYYLQNPPLLVPPVSGKPLVLYLTVTEAAMGCVLGQHDETGRKERAIYYLSKKFTECESRYTEIERLCCALVWAAKRLRHYMLYYTTWLISKVDPLRYICNKPFLSSRIARWQVLLAEYDIVYMTRKAVKGSAIADHLADNAVEDYEPLDFDFPDEDILLIEKEEEKTDWWTMFFDGAVNVYGNGAGAVIISPNKKQYPVSVKLHFECTNNTAEYEACILGLEAALELKIKKLDVYGDSMLIICQVKGEWQTKEEKLRSYQEYLSTLAKEFEEIRFTHLGREGNHFADALATLAAMTTIDLKCKVQPLHIDIRNDPAHCCLVEGEMDGQPWYYDIKNLVQNHVYPVGASKTDKKTLRRLAVDFYLDGEILYKRSFDGTLLRCLNEEDARKALREVHEGICSTHASGHMIARKIQRAGYFWMTLEKDCIDYVRKCHKCQVYSDKVNMPPAPLFNLISPWPFAMWGIDVIGPVNPKASNGHRFILVAIDYFTKWVEANSYAHVTQKVVKRFIEKDLICRYGPPEKIVTDNAQNFNGKMIVELCTKWKIKHSNSSPYRPKMNGAVEAANKNIKKIIQKMVVTYRDWHEMLSFALHAYRTTVRTSTGTTPYSLVYGMEAVMPLEVEIPSLRVLMDSELEEAEWAKVRYEQLNLISEKRMAAICHHQLYQKRMAKAYDKKVRPRLFQEGDLVLKKILSLPGDDQSKWAPNYEGPYIVKKAFSGGALKLARMDGEDLARPVNSDSVKRYYA
ncbi:LOW QUALITY PROTEIN: uncharacterized protein LOC127904008 [Populus trichocarpa]|uniref:LOW QUALITY PROTEIN: uncharacterized protein LOC127904008 n=1 Tax=Populus trichocarpa TaxID=3694 RepID=UPI0022789694|nr:LOW QUALITY PROTEIN: uncharacterized protein LOC127904008 [Populus trichocarpa]